MKRSFLNWLLLAGVAVVLAPSMSFAWPEGQCHIKLLESTNFPTVLVYYPFKSLESQVATTSYVECAKRAIEESKKIVYTESHVINFSAEAQDYWYHDSRDCVGTNKDDPNREDGGFSFNRYVNCWHHVVRGGSNNDYSIEYFGFAFFEWNSLGGYVNQYSKIEDFEKIGPMGKAFQSTTGRYPFKINDQWGVAMKRFNVTEY